MLKKILDTLEGQSEAIAALYKEGADKKFHLQVEGDDGAELKRAKEHEVGLRKIAEQERDAARTELATATGKVNELTAAQSTDVNKLRTELTADHERLMNAANEKHKKEVDSLNTAIKKTFVDSVASGIAKEITVDEGSAELLTEILKRRLNVEVVNGEPLTRVLSPTGEASTMTPDQLKTEYFTNEKYASIMRASGASGGGAGGGSKGGGASKPFKEWGDAERSALAKSNPVEFNRLVAADAAEQTA